MDDRTHQPIAPAALFGAPIRSIPLAGATGQLQQPVAERPAAVDSVHARADCGRQRESHRGLHVGPGGRLSPNCADVEIGRRNIEGGGRISDYEHENYRAVLGTKGDLLERR